MHSYATASHQTTECQPEPSYPNLDLLGRLKQLGEVWEESCDQQRQDFLLRVGF